MWIFVTLGIIIVGIIIYYICCNNYESDTIPYTSPEGNTKLLEKIRSNNRNNGDINVVEAYIVNYTKEPIKQITVSFVFLNTSGEKDKAVLKHSAYLDCGDTIKLRHRLGSMERVVFFGDIVTTAVGCITGQTYTDTRQYGAIPVRMEVYYTYHYSSMPD